MTAHCGKRFRATHFNKPLKTANLLIDPTIPYQPPKPRTEVSLEPRASLTGGVLLPFPAILVPCEMDAWILQPWASFGTWLLLLTSEWWQLVEDQNLVRICCLQVLVSRISVLWPTVFAAPSAALLKCCGSGSLRKGSRGVSPVLSLSEYDLHLANCRGSHREGPNPLHFIRHKARNCKY